MGGTKHTHALFLLVTTALLWSLAGVLIKGVSLSAPAVAGLRSAVALPVLLLFFSRKSVDFSPIQLIGGTCYAATVILFVLATKLTTAGNAILLQYTAPIYVALLSGWLLGEKIQWFDWVTIMVVLCGMVLFFLDQLSAGGMVGNIVALCSGVALAALTIALRKQKDGSPAGSAILGNLFTVLICLPWMLRTWPEGNDWISLIFLGVFQLGLSYILYVTAIRYVSAMEGILVPVIEPILNPVWVFLWMGERLSSWALLGGLVVIFAVVFRGIADARCRLRS